MTREELCKNTIKEIKLHKRVALLWGTGVGKGYTAVNTLKELKPQRILLIVNEISHKTNWRNEFVKCNCSEIFDMNVTVDCYASLKNHINTSWDFIVFDEFHHLGTENRMSTVVTLKADMVMCLSATMNDKELMYCLERTFGRFSKSRVSLQNAIDNDYLPEPRIEIYELTLNSRDRNCEIIEEWGKAPLRKTYECNFEQRWQYLKGKKTTYQNAKLIIHCTQLQKYLYLCERFDYWKKLYMGSRKEIFKNKWLMAGSERKRFLGECKTPIVKQLIDNLDKENTRYICFCTSIEQAETLGGENAIHSQKSDRELVLNKFNSLESNKLFAVGMLTEGSNLSDIEAGIIVQLDGQERTLWQKMGRTMRALEPVQYIFYFKNTRDEDFLKNLTEGINPDYCKTYKI